MREGKIRIIEELSRNKEGIHLRDLSRRIDISFPTVVEHINNYEKEGIVKTRKKGNIKLCKLDFSNKKTISLLQLVENKRFEELPYKIRESCNMLVKELVYKPLILLIFGSYATKTYTKDSDLDILLVFQKIDNKLVKEVENLSEIIKNRTAANLQPISLEFKEFEKKILDKENEFMKDIREKNLVIIGFEWFYPLIERFFG